MVHELGPEAPAKSMSNHWGVRVIHNDEVRAAYEYISAHEDYLSNEPAFDAANTAAGAPDLPCPVIDVAGLRRLIDFGVRDR